MQPPSATVMGKHRAGACVCQCGLPSARARPRASPRAVPLAAAAPAEPERPSEETPRKRKHRRVKWSAGKVEGTIEVAISEPSRWVKRWSLEDKTQLTPCQPGRLVLIILEFFLRLLGLMYQDLNIFIGRCAKG